MNSDRFYIIAVEGGIHLEIHGPFPEQDLESHFDQIYNTQDPETDMAWKLRVRDDGTLEEYSS